MQSVTMEENIFKHGKQIVNPFPQMLFQTIYKSIMLTLISHSSYERMECCLTMCTDGKLMLQNLISDSASVNIGFLL